MKMENKAQLAIFVIVAIVIVGVIGLFFVLRGRIDITPGISPEIQPIYDYIHGCASSSLVNASFIMGFQGGYIAMPEGYLKTNLSDFGYGIYKGKKVLVSRDDMEKVLESFIETTMDSCEVQQAFLDYDIELKEPNAEVVIFDNNIELELDYDFVASKEDVSYSIDKPYLIEIETSLGKLQGVAEQIVDKSLEDSENIDLDYLTDLDYEILIIPYNETTFIYSITDYDYELNEVNPVFVFANSF